MKLKIKYFLPNEVSLIPNEEWSVLSKNSQFHNPFYDKEAFIKSLLYLRKNEKIYIVTAYNDEKLVTLFPIHIKKIFFDFNHIAVWKNSHCFISDPLCSKPNFLDSIIKDIIQKFRVLTIRIEAHSYKSYGKYFQKNSYSITNFRGVITKCNDIKKHLSWLPKKIRSENNRITNRLFHKTGAVYLTSETTPEINWLHEYCRLEHAGWKGAKKGSIYSKENETQYYKELIKIKENNTKVEFQGIFLNQETLAISFRLVANNHSYDLKTTYNEKYRHLYPGVILELMNLQALSDSNYQLVDSCTSAGNKVINRLWPDTRQLLTTTFFSNHPIAKALKIIYKIKSLTHKI